MARDSIEISEQTQPLKLFSERSERSRELRAKYADLDLNVQVSNMAQLDEICPDLKLLMMEGIADQILGQMRGHQQRLKELIREGRRQA